MREGELVKRKIPKTLLKEPILPLTKEEKDYLYNSGFEDFKKVYASAHINAGLKHGYEDFQTATSHLQQDAWLFMYELLRRFDKASITKRSDSPLLLYKEGTRKYLDCIYNHFFSWANKIIRFSIMDSSKNTRKEVGYYFSNVEEDQDIDIALNGEGDIFDYTKKEEKDSFEMFVTGKELEDDRLESVQKELKLDNILRKFFILKEVYNFSCSDLEDEFGLIYASLLKKTKDLIKKLKQEGKNG